MGIAGYERTFRHVGEKDLKKSINFGASLLAAFMYPLIHIMLFVVHVATTYLIWRNDGIWSAAIVFVTPPFSELFVAFGEWNDTGNFWNTFMILNASVILVYVFQIILALIITSTDEKTA